MGAGEQPRPQQQVRGWWLAARAHCLSFAALYGVLFDSTKEAAFANYRLWEALGFVIAFGYSTFLCVSVKLYVLLGVLCASMLAYGAVELLEARSPAGPLAREATELAQGAETQTKM